jgi:hypothetical protein
MLAVVVAFWFAGGASAAASTLSKGSGQPVKAASHHHCKCREACRGPACCCFSDDEPRPSAPSRPRSTEPVKQTTPPDTGPCFGAAPCGGDGVPVSGAGWSVVKSALVVGPGARFLVSPGSYFAEASPALHASHFTSRLDEPPEAPFLP